MSKKIKIETENKELRNKARKAWHNMLDRVDGGKYRNYPNAKVCDEWRKDFENFYSWFKLNYRDGYQLDKDILGYGSMTYSPSSCCYIPPMLNKMFGQCDPKHGEYAYLSDDFKRSRLVNNVFGETFTFSGETKKAYKDSKKAKALYIQRLAKRYFDLGMISEIVYTTVTTRLDVYTKEPFSTLTRMSIEGF